MTWDEAMQYHDMAKEVAEIWGRKMDRPDEAEDLAQHLMIVLVEGVDLTKVWKGNQAAYVRSALWNKSSSYFLAGRQGHWFRMLPFATNEDGEFVPPDQLAFEQAWINLRMNEDPKDKPAPEPLHMLPPHGTTRRYDRGCRCDKCGSAANKRYKQYKQAKALVTNE
jgi:hypothetical protein